MKRILSVCALVILGNAGCESCEFSYGMPTAALFWYGGDPERCAQATAEICDENAEDCYTITPQSQWVEPDSCQWEVPRGRWRDRVVDCAFEPNVVRLSLDGCATWEVAFDDVDDGNDVVVECEPE